MMATKDKESSAAGTDNRPPMLEESNFESWKIRIERYIRGKPLGKLIWKSIKNGPTPHPMITVTTGEGEQQTQGKYVTIVKNNKDISTVSYVDLYTHLKSYEQHAMKTLSNMNQSSENADPLAYMTQATQSSSYTLSQYVPPLPQYAPAPQQAPQSTNDVMLATMNKIVNLLSGFQKQFPPTNNQLETSTNPTTQASIQAGQITTESVQRRALGHTGKHVATGSQGNKKGNQEYRSVVNAQGKLVKCYNCRVSHEDAYDSDVDEGPHAAVTFMANLKQTGPSTGEGINNDIDFHAEVQTYNNHFFDNLNHQVSQEMHRGEQLESDVDSVIDDHDNTIPYHQYQLNNKVESVPTDVSSVIPGGISVITILDDLRSQLAGHIKVQNLEQSKVKRDLEQLVFERNKQNADLEEQLVSLKQQLLQHVESYKSLKTECKKLKNDKNDLEELVCLRNTNKVVTELLKSYGQPVQIVPMLSKRPTFSSKDLHKSALGHRNPLYLKIAQLCCPTLYLGGVIVDPIHTPFRVYDSEETIVQAKLSREQVYWLSANEVASSNSNQSKPVTDFIRTRPAKSQVNTQLKMLKACFPEFDKELEHKVQKYKACFENPQLKEELTAVRIEHDSLKDANVSIKKRYQDLYKSKAECNCNVSSGAAVPEKLKVLAPGLYAMIPKYVPPQKRNNREVNTPLHRNEKVSSVKKALRACVYVHMNKICH
nr:hypothetical protein [Tanacetum cinerariifolium]